MKFKKMIINFLPEEFLFGGGTDP